MSVWAALRHHRADSAIASGILARRTFLTGCLAGLASAALPAATLLGAEQQADTSARARAEAARLLPLSELTAETRRKLLSGR